MPGNERVDAPGGEAATQIVKHEPSGLVVGCLCNDTVDTREWYGGDLLRHYGLPHRRNTSVGKIIIIRPTVRHVFFHSHTKAIDEVTKLFSVPKGRDT